MSEKVIDGKTWSAGEAFDRGTKVDLEVLFNNVPQERKLLPLIILREKNIGVYVEYPVDSFQGPQALRNPIDNKGWIVPSANKEGKPSYYLVYKSVPDDGYLRIKNEMIEHKGEKFYNIKFKVIY